MTKNSFILILLLLTTLYPKNIRDTLHIQKREKSNAGGVLIHNLAGPVSTQAPADWPEIFLVIAVLLVFIFGGFPFLIRERKRILRERREQSRQREMEFCRR